MSRMKKMAVILLMILLTGCSPSQIEYEGEVSGNTFAGMEKEPVISYEMPAASPAILINQYGYKNESSKVAIFKGSEMPEEFYVVQEDTGERVYTGYLENKGYNEKSQEYNCYGDFSGVSQPGTYYIEAPILGRSYSFKIGEDLYGQALNEACRQFYYSRCGMTLTKEFAGEEAHNACHTGKARFREEAEAFDGAGGWHQTKEGSREAEWAARNIGAMLFAYELYGEAFGDDTGIPESGNNIPDVLDEIRYETDWLLKMQNEQTGAVYAGITVCERDRGMGIISYVEPEDIRSSKAFAMALAKFSYLYQDYDAEYAGLCLRAAENAWRYVKRNDTAPADSLKFAAAAELYRASGRGSFHRIVLEYLEEGSYKDGMDEIDFLGCAAYISTSRQVELTYCAEIAEVILTKAEEISKETRGSIYRT
ncbi:MAG: glycoside hydrolase family 9 protein, partial [Lachnospiraceae bacterium]|nr:glycoside hydrolase family 9 protein [Lachnospiraceae bacterium]